jgi:leucyl aminopeptidase (aminopeptidase T)
VKVIEKLTSQDTVRTLTPDELKLGTDILHKNLGFKKNESVLIVTDGPMKNEEAAIWFESAKTITSKVDLIVLEGMTHSGEEPPEEVVTAAAKADISFFHTSYSLTHTQAGKAVTKNKHRGFSLPTVDYVLMMRTLTLDYTSVKQLGEKVKKLVEASAIIHITSEAGTDLKAEIRKEKIYNDGGILTNGEIGNLPAGEVFFAPILGSANGNLVIDGSIADDDLDEPIKVTIENGLAVHFSGGLSATHLWEKLTEFGKKGCTVAEIGIGTNPQTHPTGELIEAEKAYGTIHVAFGNSSAIGGENDVPIHLDGVLLYPRVRLDEKVLLEDREFQLV